MKYVLLLCAYHMHTRSTSTSKWLYVYVNRMNSATFDSSVYHSWDDSPYDS